jgi:YidC/Oxa1 family membrane protein insertase
MRPPLGCLLMFAQFPIFIAVYRVFLQSVELRQQEFLWIGDLAQPDHMLALPFSFDLPCFCMPFPLTISHINFLPLVWMVLMQLNQKFSVQRMEDMTDQQAQQMKMMRWITPVFGLMFWNVPAAAALYVIVSTTFGMGESYLIRKKLAAAGLRPGAAAATPMV